LQFAEYTFQMCIKRAGLIKAVISGCVAG